MAIDLITQDQASGVIGPTDSIEFRKLNEIITQVNTNTAALAGATNPFNYIGDVAAAADFPTPAAVKEGHVYRVTADCIDNDPTKTNTGQHFLDGSLITWDGVSAWMDSNPEESGIVVIAATPYPVPDGIHTVIMQTVTIGGPSVVALPPALALRVGRSIQVIDGESGAAANPISITPAGADQIDNVAAPLVIESNDGRGQVTCAAAGAWYSGPDAQVWERLTAIGAGRSVQESFQHTAATETLRLFRAPAAGVILAVAAETGVAAAVGESMTIDVEIAGVSCLAGVITIDDTVVIDTPEAGVLDPLAVAFVAGDLVRAVRTYVPGGGPTPMADSVVSLQVQFG